MIKLRFISSELNAALTIIKRIYKDKKVAQLYICSQGEYKYELYGKNEDGSMKIYMEIPTEDTEYFKIECNPFELSDFGKFKKEEINLIHANGFLVREGTKDKIPYKEAEVETKYYNDDTEPVKDHETLIKILKSAEITLKAAKEYNTEFMRLDGELGIVTLPKELHFYKVRTQFPFKVAFLHKTAISFIAKTIKKEFSIGIDDDGDYLVIKYENFFFKVHIKKPVIFPNLKLQRVTRKKYVMNLEPNDFLEAIKEYKAKDVSRIKMTYDKDLGLLELDPRVEGYDKAYVKARIEEGEFEMTIFDLDVLKSLFTFYEEKKKKEKKKTKEEEKEEEDLFSQTSWMMDEDVDWLNDIPTEKVEGVKIEALGFIVAGQKEGVVWQLETIDKKTWVGGVIEPDFEKLDKYYAEGRLKELY